jgi:hypothetical protein
MEKHTDKNGKAFDESQATSIDVKPPYQPPVVMPLGAVAKGWGVCQAGPGPKHGHGGCTNGVTVHGHHGCQAGSGR